MPEEPVGQPPTVVVVLARCQHDRTCLFGNRVERAAGPPDTWLCTWSFRIAEGTADRERYGDQVTGTFDSVESYPGCPCCQATAGCRCSSCGRLTCWDGRKRLVARAWCGARGLAFGKVSRLGAGGDR
jgi:hypothetical protein